MSLVLIDNYDSFTFNLYQMVQVLVPEPIKVFRNDALNFQTLVSLKPTGIIISPGPGHPANESDFGVCKDVIVNHSSLNCPVLGVCLGHQGMVYYLGGKVVQAPQIVHGKSSMVQVVQKSKLFEGLPAVFEAMRYHSLVASGESFPEDLVITAREKDHDLIMACQHVNRPLYGVQFHPESIGTPEGMKMLRNFVETC